jgi:hypothetical protein
VKLYRVTSKRRSDPEDRRLYLHSTGLHSFFDRDGSDKADWCWTTSPAHADTFTRNEALRYAKSIRRRWYMPARVEVVL